VELQSCSLSKFVSLAQAISQNTSGRNCAHMESEPTTTTTNNQFQFQIIKPNVQDASVKLTIQTCSGYHNSSISRLQDNNIINSNKIKFNFKDNNNKLNKIIYHIFKHFN